MIRPFLLSLLCLWPSLAPAQELQKNPVVVELFTSQGCSACPPADAFLGRLSNRPDVLALALHVDYWDYIGWDDRFALPEHTQRQKRYARAAGRKMIYTPQMVIAGELEAQGHDVASVLHAVDIAKTLPREVALELTREDDTVTVAVRPMLAGRQPTVADIVLIRILPQAEMRVTRGENAGRDMHHHNVVTQWHKLGRWDGRAPARFEAELGPDQPGAVLVQAPGPGPIYAAARLPRK